VTVIGGGTGSFNVLSGLHSYEILDINSIVTMMDSGGDSGRLRDEFGVLPPGDIRRCLVALSEESKLLRDLFSFRFREASLNGRSFGNLFFIALTRILGSEEEAIKAMGRILKTRGRVLPVTLDHASLHATLADGSSVTGEANIDLPQHDTSIPIAQVYLAPKARANPEAIHAIATSEFIVLAPGNLFTSTIPNFLVQGIPEALQNAKAPLIGILNLMTVPGETAGYTASKHISEITRYAGRVPDAVLLHDGAVPPHLRRKYRSEEAAQVEIDLDELRRTGVKTIKRGDVMSAKSFVRHDADRTAAALMELFSELDTRKNHDGTNREDKIQPI